MAEDFEAPSARTVLKSVPLDGPDWGYRDARRYAVVVDGTVVGHVESWRTDLPHRSDWSSEVLASRGWPETDHLSVSLPPVECGGGRG